MSRFAEEFDFTPRSLANDIEKALQKGLPEFIDASHNNADRMLLIECLIDNVLAKKYLLEMQRGYVTIINDQDEVLYSGFQKKPLWISKRLLKSI